MFPAPIAKLRQLNLALHFFLVFLAPIIDALAGRAREFDQSVLGHRCLSLSENKKPRKRAFARS